MTTLEDVKEELNEYFKDHWILRDRFDKVNEQAIRYRNVNTEITKELAAWNSNVLRMLEPEVFYQTFIVLPIKQEFYVDNMCARIFFMNHEYQKRRVIGKWNYKKWDSIVAFGPA